VAMRHRRSLSGGYGGVANKEGKFGAISNPRQMSVLRYDNPRTAREFTRVREGNLERLVINLKNAHKTRELVLASGLHFILVVKI